MSRKEKQGEIIALIRAVGCNEKTVARVERLIADYGWWEFNRGRQYGFAKAAEVVQREAETACGDN